MASAKKTTPVTATATATATATPAVVAKKTVEKKAVDKKAITPASPSDTKVAATPSETKVDETVAVADSQDETLIAQLAEQSAAFLGKLQQITSTIAALKTEYRSLEKKWSRELKLAQKQSNKRKKKAGNRAPSGFVKPTLISPELASFLEKPTGSEMARTEVTRDINKYIRANNLQDKANGRKINPDAKLAALLKIGKTDELTYFNLQKYMSPHFAKSVKTA